MYNEDFVCSFLLYIGFYIVVIFCFLRILIKNLLLLIAYLFIMCIFVINEEDEQLTLLNIGR